MFLTQQDHEQKPGTGHPGSGSGSNWQMLLRLRWLLGGAIALAFALGRLLEALLLNTPQSYLVIDVVVWGLLGGLAVWLSLTWASRQERRYQEGVERALREQQELNHQLQRANSHLELLSAVNRHIADSSTLDEILDAALAFPQRLVPARAAALLLSDPTGPIETRVERASTEELSDLRAMLAVDPPMVDYRHPHHMTIKPLPNGSAGACLILPLHDGLAPVGWIALYLEHTTAISEDELALLETITAEIAEAIVSARRRSREERSIYELERAIAEERARIARDIHDGLAQSLAFLRMRVDLWNDWITDDPQRLRVELSDLKHTLREQIRELRRAIFALRPVQFDELGFVGGLHRYIVEFAGQHAWEVQVDLRGAPQTLAPEQEAICFRIVQEALTNVAKHANAACVKVTINQIDQGLQVVVHDNGCGFDPEVLAADGYGHVGLRQMNERLAAIRGQLTLLSRPGAGTELRAWLPLVQGSEIRPNERDADKRSQTL